MVTNGQHRGDCLSFEHSVRLSSAKLKACSGKVLEGLFDSCEDTEKAQDQRQRTGTQLERPFDPPSFSCKGQMLSASELSSRSPMSSVATWWLYLQATCYLLCQNLSLWCWGLKRFPICIWSRGSTLRSCAKRKRKSTSLDFAHSAVRFFEVLLLGLVHSEGLFLFERLSNQVFFLDTSKAFCFAHRSGIRLPVLQLLKVIT